MIQSQTVIHCRVKETRVRSSNRNRANKVGGWFDQLNNSDCIIQPLLTLPHLSQSTGNLPKEEYAITSSPRGHL